MSRSRQSSKFFALLACLVLLISAVGCQSDSVLSPVEGSGGDDAGSTYNGTSSAPQDKASDQDGPALSSFGDVNG